MKEALTVTPTAFDDAAASENASLSTSTFLGPLHDKTHLLLTAKRQHYTSWKRVVRSSRFLLRTAQLISGLISLVGLYVAAFGVNYTSASIGISGINICSFTSVTSAVVSLTYIFSLLFPTLVGIAATRQHTISKVEAIIDIIYGLLWMWSSITLATGGSCPRYLFRIPGTPEYLLYNSMAEEKRNKILNVDCLPWNLCWAFGIVETVLYFVSVLQYFMARKVRKID